MKLQGYDDFTSDVELISYDEEINNLELKQSYLAWLNDLEVVKSIGSEVLMNPNKSLDFIEESFFRFTSSNSCGFFVKYLPADRYVGTVKLDKIDYKNKRAEVGAMIGEKDFWGKKITQKSYLILQKYAFEVLELNCLWGGCLESNIASVHTFLKTNFKQDGIMRDYLYWDNKYQYIYIFNFKKGME